MVAWQDFLSSKPDLCAGSNTGCSSEWSPYPRESSRTSSATMNWPNCWAVNEIPQMPKTSEQQFAIHSFFLYSPLELKFPPAVEKALLFDSHTAVFVSDGRVAWASDRFKSWPVKN